MRAAHKNDPKLPITSTSLNIFQQNLFFSLNSDKLPEISKGEIKSL